MTLARNNKQKLKKKSIVKKHITSLILSVLQKEKETLKSELSEAKAVSTIFNSSTRLKEALAIIVQFVDSQWN